MPFVLFIGVWLNIAMMKVGRLLALALFVSQAFMLLSAPPAYADGVDGDRVYCGLWNIAHLTSHHHPREGHPAMPEDTARRHRSRW